MKAFFSVVLLLGVQNAPKDDKSTLELIEELKSADPVARRKALDALRDRGPEAVPAVLSVLADERLGLDEQIDGIVLKLSNKDWKTRDAAHRALVRFGRHARPRLQTHEDAEDPEVAWRVKAVLAEIEEKERDEATLEYFRNASLCEFLGSCGDSRAVPQLLKHLEQAASTNPSLAEVQFLAQARAAEALGRLRSTLSDDQVEGVVELVIELLAANRDRRSGVVLIQTLGHLRSRTVVTPLLSLVKDGDRCDVHLKRVALRALAEIDDPRGVAGIIEAMASEDVYLRDGAVEALSEIAGQDFGVDPRRSADSAQLEAARKWWQDKYEP
ncbi:MAG: HEAT repeat domain-containing protein [Planctomycetes bacterium]|nr:HEAT repeat domain-containing protein [Planctomycetota bacterium]